MPASSLSPAWVLSVDGARLQSQHSEPIWKKKEKEKKGCLGATEASLGYIARL